VEGVVVWVVSVVSFCVVKTGFALVAGVELIVVIFGTVFVGKVVLRVVFKGITVVLKVGVVVVPEVEVVEIVVEVVDGFAGIVVRFTVVSAMVCVVAGALLTSIYKLKLNVWLKDGFVLFYHWNLGSI